MNPDTERETEDLAIGFALDELEEAELDRFLAILKARDDRAARTAHLTWQALRTSMDLRASLDRDFVPVTRSRIEKSMHAGPDTTAGALEGVLGRIGASRPRLRTVELPDGRRVRRPAGLVWLLLPAMLLSLGLAWLLWPTTPAVTCDLVRGRATSEGRVFTAGRDFDLQARPLNLHAGGLARLVWADTANLRLLGPALVVPRGDGVSISTGRAVCATTTPFTIGLPDHALRLGPATTAVVQVLPGEGRLHRSQIGVQSGRLVAHSDARTGPLAIPPGSYLAFDGSLHPWHRRLHLTADPAGGRRFEPSPGPDATFRLQAEFVPEEAEASCRLIDAQKRSLAITTTALRIGGSDADSRILPLDGAPLRPRSLLLQSVGTDRVRVTLSGLDSPVVIDFGAPVRIFSPEPLRHLVANTGPPPDLE